MSLFLVCIMYFTRISFSYYMVNIPKTWDDAETFCQSQCNSHLASIHSMNNFIEVAHHSNNWSLIATWIGLRYATNHSFIWSDHTPFDFGQQLNAHQPSNDGPYACVHIRTKEWNGTWSDNLCNKTYAFICNDCIHNIDTNLPSYYVSSNRFEFQNARTYCNDHCHSELASIHTENDQQIAMYLAHIAPKLQARYVKSNSVQFGLYKAAFSSTYSYLDNTTFNYGNITSPQGIYPWLSEDPAVGSYTECVQMRYVNNPTSYQWMEADSFAESYRFMCNSCDGQLNKYAVIHEIKANHSAAEVYCNTHLKTSLASIHSQYDYDLASRLCEIANSESHDTGNYASCYIGLSRAENENVYVWNDATVFDFGNNVSDPLIWTTNNGNIANTHCVHLANDQSYTLQNADCATSRYFLCNLPSLLCREEDWYPLIGKYSFQDCEMYSNEMHEDNIIMFTKQFINNEGGLTIEHIFKFISFIDTSKHKEVNTGIVLFSNGNNDNNSCEYYYVSLYPLDNTLTLMLHTNGSDHIISTRNLTVYHLQLQLQTYYTLKITIGAVIDLYINDVRFIFVLDTNQINTLRSGYIGIRNKNANIYSKSFYVSGIAYKFNDSLPFACAHSSISPTISPSSTNLLLTLHETKDTNIASTQLSADIEAVDDNKSDHKPSLEQFASVRLALYGGGCLFAFFICCICLWIASAAIKRIKWRLRNRSRPNAIRVADFEDIEKEPDHPVRLWLTYVVRLPEHYVLFLEHGYHSIDLLKNIEDRSQLKKMGITLFGHQTRIMAQIEALKKQEEDQKMEEVELQMMHKEVTKKGKKSKPQSPQMILYANAKLVSDDSRFLIRKGD